MKKIVITLLFSLSFYSLQAQNYNNAIGVRLGGISGVTFKTMMSGSNALEVIVGGKYRGVHAVVLYEVHAEAFDVPNLFWYYGGGGHIGFWEGRYGRWFDEARGSTTAIGIDGIFGMEYQIEEIPFTVSLDLIPSFNIAEYTGFFVDGALSIRYVF